jgi:multidrug efflux pump subunit AcrB
VINLAARARPYFGVVVLATILLTAGGIYAVPQMPSGIYPEVTFPRIAVVARAPGLALANTEVQVTKPLEQALSTVIGVSQVRSKTIRGASELSLDFNPGTDMRRAEQLAWNRIGAIRSELPADLELTVEQMTPSVFPIMSLVLTGGESPAQLRDYAYYQLAPRIKNVPDVLYANVAGGDLREIVVEARPDNLIAAGLSAADLADQIGKAHRLQPVGRIERPPFAIQLLVNTQGETAQQVAELVLAVKGGQPLRVKDVADVKVLHQDRVLSVGFAGRDAVVITIFRRLGGNTVNVSRDVRELLGRQPPPRNIRATVVYDQATFVDTAVANVRDAILVGGLFSILILLAFLRSWRATLVSAVALPTTLAITFLILYLMGETLNLMSLGGLAVAVGLIIDDTVVVIENIARHSAGARASLAKGKGPESQGKTQHSALSTQYSASRALDPSPPGGPAGKAPDEDPVTAASAEITGAVVGSTLTTVLVFVPLAFIAGVYGQFFASLSRALAVAVLVSMVISLTVIPVLASHFLRGRALPGPGPIYRALAYVYERVLAMTLRVPPLTLTASLAAIGVGILLFTGIPRGGEGHEFIMKPIKTGLMPAMDEGAFVLDYFAPAGTPLEQTEVMARQIEHLLSENPDIDAYVRRTGAELGLFATRTSRGDIQVILRPAEEGVFGMFRKPERPPFSKIEDQLKKWGQEGARQKYGPDFTSAQMWEEGKAAVRSRYRRRSVTDVREEIEDEIKEHFSEHQLKVETVPIMEDELNDLSGANRPIEVKLFGPQGAELRHLAEKVADMLEEKGKKRGFKEVDSHVTAGTPDLEVDVDGVRAAKMGLTAQDVERQLRAIYFGQVATQVRESDVRITNVRVRYPDMARFGGALFSPGNLLDQWLLLPPGKWSADPFLLEGPARLVPVSAVAKVRVTRTPEEQWRENQQPVQIVTSDHNEAEAGLNSMVADIREWMGQLSLPAGYRWELGGHYLSQQEAFKSLLVVMAVAVLLVFLTLAFQFRSLLLPLLIFLTQPLSLVSGLFALWLTNTPLNVASYMGMILLIGLDMKNGILMVEYIQQLRARGVPRHQAVLEAGRTRFRPILMTSMASILGLLPLALALGPGAQMQQPLAIVVIGGLTANMLFTRMIIPAGYLLLERGQQAGGAVAP